MEKLLRKIQEIGQQAAKVQQAVKAAPGKAAELRQSVAGVVGQAIQIHADLRTALGRLKQGGEDTLVEALRELDEGAEIFARAGWRLDGVDLDLGLMPRLLIRVGRAEEVAESGFESALGEAEGRPTVQAVLQALHAADKITAGPRLQHLEPGEVTVHVGPEPVVRVGWRRPAPARATDRTAPGAEPAPAAAPTSLFGSGSYFERRSGPPEAARAVTPPTAAPAIVPQVTAKAAPAPADEDRHDPLARFKKMPDLTRRR
ncbi:MAG: hypothetical protein ACKVYV_11570 [Limisphaerales bacterium]